MNLTKKDKLAIQRLLSAGTILSNCAFNLSQQLKDANAPLLRDAYKKWDEAYSVAKEAIRKLQLPP